MKTAKFQYKCRLCGEVYTGAETCEDLARNVLICVTLGIDPTVEYQNIGIVPNLIEPHIACRNGFGVSDLIGYIVEDNDI